MGSRMNQNGENMPCGGRVLSRVDSSKSADIAKVLMDRLKCRGEGIETGETEQ